MAIRPLHGGTRAAALASGVVGCLLASACSGPSPSVAIANGASATSLSASDATGGANAGAAALARDDARIASNAKEGRGGDARRSCPRAMVDIEGRFCIDAYEASVVEVLPTGDERPHSPFESVADRVVRAVSAPKVYPQGYISAVEAQRACVASGKRLCRVSEWQKACRGPEANAFSYGQRREPGRCNDRGKNPVLSLYGRGRWNWTTMNQPDLNQLEGTLAKTGEHEGCTNGYGVYDMVGNLHEWVADPKGTFYGGYYQDVSSVGHGEGCGYLTTAHEARYHDYSTGFRCCADVAGSAPEGAPPPSPPPGAKATKRSKKR